MMNWEYKTYRFHDGGMGRQESHLDVIFDKFGADGWELVQIVASPEPNEFNHRLAIFKRPGPRAKATKAAG